MTHGARKFFPRMPDEVFELFVAQQLEPHDWSLSELEAFLAGASGSIAKHFRNKTLSYWSNINWQLTSPPFSEVNLEGSSMDKARKIMDLFGEPGPFQKTIRTQVPNSQERFNTAALFAKSMGKFPRPLVCLAHEKEWVLLDGYHRLAGMLLQGDVSDFPFDTWVGTHDH